MSTKNRDAFIRQYIATALWSSTYGENGEHNMDDGKHELSAEAHETLTTQAREFYDAHSHLWEGTVTVWDHDAERAGHDFWLTRNRHGAGFWDRHSDEPGRIIGRQLTELAHAYGEVDLYVSDDGMIEVG